MKLIKTFGLTLASATFCLTTLQAGAQETDPRSLDELLQLVESATLTETQEQRDRIARFESNVNQREQLLDDMVGNRLEEEGISGQLENIYDDNEILSCISEATKVPKKFKTEYHDFFYTKLREIEKRQLEESKEIKQKTKKNDKKIETIKVKQNNIEKETENDYELQKEDTFREMIRVALKDGKIDENELETLRLGAKMGGINDRRVNELINEEKKLIKKEDKTIKKNKKEKINNMEFKSLSKNTECYVCGEKGHLSYNCPEKNIKTHRKKLADKSKENKDDEKK